MREVFAHEIECKEFSERSVLGWMSLGYETGVKLSLIVKYKEREGENHSSFSNLVSIAFRFNRY